MSVRLSVCFLFILLSFSVYGLHAWQRIYTYIHTNQDLISGRSGVKSPAVLTTAWPVASLGGANRPGWHPPGGDTRREIFCRWIYKEQWTNAVGQVKTDAGWHPPGGDTRVKSIKVTVMSKERSSVYQEKIGATLYTVELIDDDDYKRSSVFQR